MSGQVVIPAEVPGFTDGTVHVYLQDTSYADAPAVIVAETAVEHVRHAPARPDAETTIAFQIVIGADIDPGADYALRVWVDRDGDGRTGPGDLHSDQAHRVLTGGFADVATLRLSARGLRPPTGGPQGD